MPSAKLLYVFLDFWVNFADDHSRFGPMLIGVFFNTILYGVSPQHPAACKRFNGRSGFGSSGELDTIEIQHLTPDVAGLDATVLSDI